MGHRERQAWLQVLAHVALRLRDMHGAGFVHRNVKPSNIMLLARENRWTVIDFGNATLVGQEAPISGSLAYTAPEAMRAAAAGATSTIADPAVDAWALGVVAFELLTGKQALDPLRDGHDAVRSLIEGLAQSSALQSHAGALTPSDCLSGACTPASTL